MFCIKCGKDAKIKNLCKECFLGSESLFTAEGLSVSFCKLCGLKECEIQKIIEGSIKSNNLITSKKVSLKTVGNKVYANITCVGRIRGLKKTETKQILIILRKKMCDFHVKISGGYYEAAIQIRGNKKDVILKRVMSLLPKKAVIKIEDVENGYDIRIIRKSNAAAAAKALRGGFDVKESFKLVGSKKGQKLYRNFYAIR